MTLRRRRELDEGAARAARRLRQCEAATALLDRVRPRNLSAERSRLLSAWRAGRRRSLELEYAAPAELTSVRRALEALARDLDVRELEPRLLLERTTELALEAELAERVGTPGFRDLAARLFPLPPNDADLRRIARSFFVPHAVSAPERDALSPGSTHLSDDRGDPSSLFSQLSRGVSARHLPVRVEVDTGLVALAAVAEGVVRVRAGARLSADVARRIALHEIEGHLLPRSSGAALGGVFMAGSRHAAQDEEGRAISIEERAGLLDPGRRAELGRRYLAAASVRDGAAFEETVELLLETGADLAASIELGCRVHRGGGLGRELVYLVGYRRVRAALLTQPELEPILAAGRVSLEAARRLSSEVVIT